MRNWIITGLLLLLLPTYILSAADSVDERAATHCVQSELQTLSGTLDYSPLLLSDLVHVTGFQGERKLTQVYLRVSESPRGTCLQLSPTSATCVGWLVTVNTVREWVRENDLFNLKCYVQYSEMGIGGNK